MKGGLYSAIDWERVKKLIDANGLDINHHLFNFIFLCMEMIVSKIYRNNVSIL